MSDSTAPTDSRRRRLRLLAIPVAALAVVLWILGARAHAEAPLDLHVGAQSPSVREIDVVFRDRPGDARELEVTLHFATGAPADVYKSVHLRDGDYAVSARIVTEQGERVVEREVNVDHERPTVIELE